MANVISEEIGKPIKIDHLFKLFILGDLGVGKSSLILKYTEDSFNENPSLQVDFKIKLMTLENKGIKLQLWDTHASEKSGKIDEAHYKRSHGIIFAYDITNQNSFKNIENWIKESNKFSQKNVCKILVGNKCDKSNKVVSDDEGKKLAKKFGMEFFETSAKNNQNVNEIFNFLVKEMIKVNQ